MRHNIYRNAADLRWRVFEIIVQKIKKEETAAVKHKLARRPKTSPSVIRVLFIKRFGGPVEQLVRDVCASVRVYTDSNF